MSLLQERAERSGVGLTGARGERNGSGIRVPDRYRQGRSGKVAGRVNIEAGAAEPFINLRLRDLDLATGRLWVRQGKGRKDRGLWFNGQTREALQAWLDSSSMQRGPYDYVFTSLDGRQPLCGRVLRRWIEKLGKQAGVEKRVHLHMLRHTFACKLLRKTKNLFLVSKALGHASVATTQIYLHLEDEELETAMKGLGG